MGFLCWIFLIFPFFFWIVLLFRSRKKPAKYIEVGSDVDEEAEDVAPSPKKKSKKKQPSTKPVKNAGKYQYQGGSRFLKRGHD